MALETLVFEDTEVLTGQPVSEVITEQGGTEVLIERAVDEVLVEQGIDEVLVEQGIDEVMHETVVEAEVLEFAEQGPPGPPGPAGGSVLLRVAGATLSALLMAFELDGEVFALDKDDDAHIDLLLGITVTAADVGNPINIQRTGVVDNSGWAWTPGRVYLGLAGALTQVPAASGNDVLVGRAVSATRLLLDIQDPIDLE